jgi:hypothetical protein
MNTLLRSRLLIQRNRYVPKWHAQLAQLHGTPIPQKSERDASYPSVSAPNTFSDDSKLLNRFVSTTEVIISKIFPAGFGWQGGSVIASNLGYASDSFLFAVSTGIGDALGVIIGHTAYYGCKKALTGNENINMEKEAQTGLFLGSAAFCSGTLWQPLVLSLQSAGLSFNGVMLGTWLGCSTAFYLGLRASRTLLPQFLPTIDPCSDDNRAKDATLALAIGGATGFFVGTDTVYLPSQNFLIDAVGIHPGTPNLTSCVVAGTSTSLGFFCAQSGLNFVYPSGKCWND